MATPENIHPVFHQLVQRDEKESLLNQRACAIWMTGLSGSGKTTIAKGLERALHEQGRLVMVLDGDNVRSGLNNNLSFSESDRLENIRRIAEVNKLFLSCGIITINCFVSPTVQIRQLAKDIIGSDDFVEVFVNTPLEECERRDIKGLYKKARAGEIKDFTGINAPFEAPKSPDIDLPTAGRSVEQTVEDLYRKIQARIALNNAG
jgi:adenylylsulfate kinase